MCLIDLRGLIADLYWSSGGGTSGLTFPFNEGEAEVDARARRAGEGIRMSSLFGRAGSGCVFEASPRLWVASESWLMVDKRVQCRRRRQTVCPPGGATMSPPVITWFFNPALALWPAPHDEAETTCGIKGAIVRILNGHPLRARFACSRPLRFAKGTGFSVWLARRSQH